MMTVLMGMWRFGWIKSKRLVSDSLDLTNLTVIEGSDVELGHFTLAVIKRAQWKKVTVRALETLGCAVFGAYPRT